MAENKEVVVLGGVRTPIGKFGGSLKDFTPSNLATMTAVEAIKRSGLRLDEIEQTVYGHVLNTEAADVYMGRIVALKAGLPIETPGLTVNRLCGSGLQAIATASEQIILGNATTALAGGTEVMSRSQYWLPAMRWGARLNDSQVIDSLVSV